MISKVTRFLRLLTMVALLSLWAAGGLVVYSGTSNPTPTMAPRSQLPMPQVSAQRLMQDLTVLAVERFTPAQRQQTRDYLTQQLRAAGWQPQALRFDGGSHGEGVNLVAERRGTDPRAGTLIVVAHYDTVAGSPGADDNGSGVVALLEIARLFNQHSTPRGLRLILFDLHERGLLSSFAYANQPENLQGVAGVIVLEMLGYTCLTRGCQRVPRGIPISPPNDWGDFIAVVGDTEHLPLLHSFSQTDASGAAAAKGKVLPQVLLLATPFKGVLTPDLLRSDHAPFWYQGIGAVMVTDTANFRNPNYHRISDTPATIDRDFLAGATQLVVNTTAKLLKQRQGLATPVGAAGGS